MRITEQFIRTLPKVLLHDHLDGGLRPKTIIELAREIGYTGLPTTDPAELQQQVMDLFRLCLDLGGTLSGEHGIGLAKRDAFLALSDPFQIEALRGLKRALDPAGIFNPGKVV